MLNSTTKEGKMLTSHLVFGLLCLLASICHSTQKDSTTIGLPPNKEVPLMEREVVGFRLWMILAFVFSGLLAIMVALCCLIDCRIPRTKQEIQADHERRALIEKYKSHIDVQMALGRKLKVIKAKRQKRLVAPARHSEVPKLAKAIGALVPKASPDAAPLASHPAALLTGAKAKGLGLGQPTQNKLAKTLASLRTSDMMAALKKSQFPPTKTDELV